MAAGVASLLRLFCAVLLVSGAAFAQAASRAEQIGSLRKDKQARLWPERTPGIIKRVNEYTERGLLDGFRTGKGRNGPQIILGGMRSGNGTTLGVGYRRVDAWNERLAYRATARGTGQLAYMFDFETSSPRLDTDRLKMRIYTKYENSPEMDYYGPGPDSQRENRTSYRLEDFKADFDAKYRVINHFYASGSVGGYFPNTGPGQRSGVPSIEEKFNPLTTPGINIQAHFFRPTFTLQYDYRDLASGPRSGGNYYATFTRYWDLGRDLHAYTRLDAAAEQYIPFRNKANVIALRLAASMTWAPDGQSVPFYLQPTLGGNELLRGFTRYRFYDQNAMIATAEHRWHLFAGLHAALFFEMGKVAHKASQLSFRDLEYTGGIGFRATIRDAVIMRIDNAVSREGYRFMWTFSNVF
jgi:hypothetical protein